MEGIKNPFRVLLKFLKCFFKETSIKYKYFDPKKKHIEGEKHFLGSLPTAPNDSLMHHCFYCESLSKKITNCNMPVLKLFFVIKWIYNNNNNNNNKTT